MSARLDRINQGYQEQQNLANYWAGKNAQKQHEAHKVMQDLVRLRNEEVARMNASSGGGGGGHHHAPAASPPRAAPPPRGQDKTDAGVKIPDVVVSTYDYSQATIEELEKLYFQNVGGTEILTVARHDNVNGQEVPLSYLDNLKQLNTEFNPLNILTTENIYNHFNRFAIDMTQRIDSVNQAVTVDEEGTNIVITLDEIQADEYVQIQVANVANDTDFGDGVVWRNYYGEVK
jgi:Leucine-rich repeat (LRR) protein